MIANLHEKGWEVIYHRAHALLAAQIAGTLASRKTPPALAGDNCGNFPSRRFRKGMGRQSPHRSWRTARFYPRKEN
jgi:hypothetical protein